MAKAANTLRIKVNPYVIIVEGWYRPAIITYATSFQDAMDNWLDAKRKAADIAKERNTSGGSMVVSEYAPCPLTLVRGPNNSEAAVGVLQVTRHIENQEPVQYPVKVWLGEVI